MYLDPELEVLLKLEMPRQRPPMAEIVREAAQAYVAREAREAPLVPEIDWLLGRRLGARSRAVFSDGITAGYYLVTDLPRASYIRVAELNRNSG